ncbi:MAG TPA: helix-turn-helix transcriptional regulator [Firmicutes bacterium]|nr:helix-turn-helix transcriptional regulator [Bacillota bacterium]
MDAAKWETCIDHVLEKNEREEDCPIRRVLKVLSGQWRPQIIYTLYKHPACRFGQLQKAMPRVTNAMLTATLRDLERIGIVERTQFNEVPPHVEYSLTDKGRALLPIFYEMTVWGEKYLGDEGMLER